MKALLFAPLLALAACTVETSAPSMDFPSGPPKPETPAVVKKSSFRSACIAQDRLSFRLSIEMQNDQMTTSQTTYLASGQCIEHPESANVQTSSVDASTFTTKLSPGGDSIQLKGKDGKEYKLTKVGSAKYGADIGVFVQYKGTAGTGAAQKPASYFAQIIDYSPYADHFPYVWTYQNGREVNPRGNPWVWSGAKTSSDWFNQVWTCKTFEEVDVPAGHFDTCVVESNGEKTWYGNTPLFNIIKYQKGEGAPSTNYYLGSLITELGLPSTAAMTLELTSFGY